MRRFLWPVGVLLVTGLYGLLPLLGSRDFYMRGDTAAQFAPTWFHLGELVRGGTWPTWLDPASFAGGNYAAEALFGIYNPLNALIWLAVSASPDLLVVVTAVKITVLMLLALGTYLLAREYDAVPWAAAVVATALPFSGFTLYWDAGSWPSGLIAFAYAPWVWWSFRRTLRGAGNPVWAVLVGALAITQGNPYGTLAVVVVGLGLLVEGLLARNLRGVGRLVLVGLCVAAFLPLVYLPLLEASDLAARSSGPLFDNSGKLRPEAGDLLGLSGPTYVPGIRAIVGPMQVPATYFAWFLLPLLPWLRYDALRRRGRELAGIGVVGVIYLLLTLGPSKLWLFRWPLRLIEYTWLALAVALAVALSAGLARDRWRARTSTSAALVLLTAFLSWSQHPTWTSVAFGGTIMLALTTLVLLVWHRWGHPSPRLLALLLIAGTGLVLLGQSATFKENESSRLWHLPHDVSAIQERFGDRDGRVMQFADLTRFQRSSRDKELRASWETFLPGSMYHVAGVDAVNNYTGMGFRPFERTFCLHYEGFSRPCGYRNVWTSLEPGQPTLADLLKLDTIVVGNQQAEGVTPAENFEVVSTGRAIVLERTDELPWPDSRLSWASPGVEVEKALTIDAYHEEVRLSAPEGGTLVLAALDWPGHTATIDGRTVPLSHNSAGLMTVELPRGAEGTLEISYQPPGLATGLAGAAAGTAGGLLLGLLALLGTRRRREREESPAGDGVVVAADQPVTGP